MSVNVKRKKKCPKLPTHNVENWRSQFCNKDCSTHSCITHENISVERMYHVPYTPSSGSLLNNLKTTRSISNFKSHSKKYSLLLFYLHHHHYLASQYKSMHSHALIYILCIPCSILQPDDFSLQLSFYFFISIYINASIMSYWAYLRMLLYPNFILWLIFILRYGTVLSLWSNWLSLYLLAFSYLSEVASGRDNWLLEDKFLLILSINALVLFRLCYCYSEYICFVSVTGLLFFLYLTSLTLHLHGLHKVHISMCC